MKFRNLIPGVVFCAEDDWGTMYWKVSEAEVYDENGKRVEDEFMFRPNESVRLGWLPGCVFIVCASAFGRTISKPTPTLLGPFKDKALAAKYIASVGGGFEQFCHVVEPQGDKPTI